MLDAGLPEFVFQVLIGNADIGKWITTNPNIAIYRKFIHESLDEEFLTRFIERTKAL
jgi:hypothetical protein